MIYFFFIKFSLVTSTADWWRRNPIINPTFSICLQQKATKGKSVRNKVTVILYTENCNNKAVWLLKEVGGGNKDSCMYSCISD